MSSARPTRAPVLITSRFLIILCIKVRSLSICSRTKSVETVWSCAPVCNNLIGWYVFSSAVINQTVGFCWKGAGCVIQQPSVFHWKRCKWLVPGSTCDMKNILIFIYSGILNEGDGVVTTFRLFNVVIRLFFCKKERHITFRIFMYALIKVWRKSYLGLGRLRKKQWFVNQTLDTHVERIITNHNLTKWQ